jgi:hypothetical protein
MVLAICAIVALDIAVVASLALLMRSTAVWGTGPAEAKQIERQRRVSRARAQTARRVVRVGA